MKLRIMGRALAVLFVFGAVLGAVVPVGAAAPEPRSSLGVSSGKAFRAGWYEEITGDCEAVKNVPAELFGTVSTGGLAFVGGTGLVGTTGAATSTSFGAAFLGTVGAGSALVTGAQVAAVSAVGVTAFCGTLLGLQWLNGEGAYAPALGTEGSRAFGEYVFGQGLIPCLDIPGFVPTAVTNQCVRSTSYDRLSSFWVGPYNNGSTQFYESSAKMWIKQLFSWVQADLPRGTGYRPYGQTWDVPGGLQTEAVLELECASAFLCVQSPNTATSQQSWNGTGTDSRGIKLRGPAISSGSYPQRLITRSYCNSPENVTQLFTGTGSFGPSGKNISDPGPLADLCPSGWLKLTYNLEREKVSREYRGAGHQGEDINVQPRGTGDTESLKTWTIPPYVAQNPTLRQCYLSGWTNCEATTTNGVTTVNNTTTGGTTVIVLNAPQVKVDDALRAVDNAIEAVSPVPTTVPVTSPTTVPNPTTVPTTVPNPTTIPTPSTTVPCSGIACESSDPEPPDGDTDGCFSTGYSWNPVSWVLVPIKCSFTWLFVPSGPNWDSVTDDLDGLSDSPPLSWVVGGSQLLTGSSVQFVRWADADLPSFTVQGYTFDFASLDGAEAPTAVKVMLIIALWILLAYCVVRFL